MVQKHKETLSFNLFFQFLNIEELGSGVKEVHIPHSVKVIQKPNRPSFEPEPPGKLFNHFVKSFAQISTTNAPPPLSLSLSLSHLSQPEASLPVPSFGPAGGGVLSLTPPGFASPFSPSRAIEIFVPPWVVPVKLEFPSH
jgi:hypothetical protein